MLPSVRRGVAALCGLALTAALTGPATALAGDAPPAAAQTTAPTATPAGGSPVLPLTTTTTSPPATQPPSTAPTTQPAGPAATKPSPTSTTRPPKGVPSVPVGGPPASSTTTTPGAPPPPPPDPTPILTTVSDEMAQLTAIDDYKPAQALVAAAQQKVTAAGAALQSAHQVVETATADTAQAQNTAANADSKLRAMAIAAYIGVGYSTPGMGAPATGNGDQGPGTVSTPGGLTGIAALDAKEMLLLVGEKARSDDQSAHQGVALADQQLARANAAYAKAASAVSAAEAQLMSAQQTLKLVTTAATTPGVAGATKLPVFTTASATQGPAQPPTPATGPSTTRAAAQMSDAAATGGAPSSPAILGPAALTGADLAAWFASTGRKANTTVPIAQLAMDYEHWGNETGVRYDLAFAQSVVETGFFSFPAGGQLTAQDNNFAGIGACDTCAHGWSFPDASTGVEAQLELLHEYATSSPLPKLPDLKNVIGGTGVGGCCPGWIQLAGVWASSLVYGISIMTVYSQMLSWLIPERQVAAGLVAANAPAVQGPQLAPLPGPPAQRGAAQAAPARPGAAQAAPSQ